MPLAAPFPMILEGNDTPIVTVTQQPTRRTESFIASIAADDVSIKVLIAFVLYPSLGTSAVIFDGTNITAEFDGASSLVGDDEGYVLTAIPNAGWASDPKIYIHAMSETGDINAP